MGKLCSPSITTEATYCYASAVVRVCAGWNWEGELLPAEVRHDEEHNMSFRVFRVAMNGLSIRLDGGNHNLGVRVSQVGNVQQHPRPTAANV